MKPPINQRIVNHYTKYNDILRRGIRNETYTKTESIIYLYIR